MITDFFDGVTCERCGYAYKQNGVPLHFERLDQVASTDGITYLCRCNVCGTTFRKIYSGVTENGKGKDSILTQF